MLFPRALSLLCIATCLLASARGQDPDLRYTLQGVHSDDEFGSSVAAVGDLDGDLCDDFLVGVPQESPNGTHSGRALVFSGKDGSIMWTFDGDMAFARAGEGVGCAGDVNADGTLDVIVGMPGAGGGMATAPGRARVFSGLDGSVLYTFTGDLTGDRFGLSVACAGDVNGDMHDDVIVGASGNFLGTTVGYARVFSGIDGAVLFTLLGAATLGDRFAFAVGGNFDVNMDAVPDLVVGAIADAPNGPSSGRAYVFSGVDGSTLWTFDGDATSDQFGHGVAAMRDVDGDGRDDILVSAFNAMGVGYARVFSGFNGTLIQQVTGQASGDGFGHAVASRADVNGDGIDDLIIGASGDSSQGLSLAGSVHVFSGATGSRLGTYHGLMANGRMGYQVAGAGDVNADGFDDILCGSLVAGAPGYVRTVSVAVAEPYGIVNSATQTMTMAWVEGPAGDVGNGSLLVAGATPFGIGILGISTLATQTSFLAVDLFVDLTPGVGLIMSGIPFTPSGTLSLPLDLSVPAFHGIALFVQAFEVNLSAPLGLFGSNAVVVRYTK